jgi:hypothetical protein
MEDIIDLNEQQLDTSERLKTILGWIGFIETIVGNAGMLISIAIYHTGPYSRSSFALGVGSVLIGAIGLKTVFLDAN